MLCIGLGQAPLPALSEETGENITLASEDSLPQLPLRAPDSTRQISPSPHSPCLPQTIVPGRNGQRGFGGRSGVTGLRGSKIDRFGSDTVHPQELHRALLSRFQVRHGRAVTRPVRRWSHHSIPFRLEESTAQFLVKMPVEAKGDGVGHVQRQSTFQPCVVAQLDRKGEKGLANPSIPTIPKFRLDVSGRGCDVLAIEGMSTFFKDRRESRPDVEDPSQVRPAPDDGLLSRCVGLSLVVAPFPGLPGHPSRWRRVFLLVIPFWAAYFSCTSTLKVRTAVGDLSLSRPTSS